MLLSICFAFALRLTSAWLIFEKILVIRLDEVTINKSIFFHFELAPFCDGATMRLSRLHPRIQYVWRVNSPLVLAPAG